MSGTSLARCLILAAMVLVSLAAVPGTRADPIADSVASLSADIEDLRVIGNWAHADQAGVYRVIVARKGIGGSITARLFAQWIAYVNADGSGTVVHSVEIAEIAAMATNIIDYTFETGENEVILFVETATPGPNGGTSFQVLLREPETDYKFERQSN